MKSPIRPSVRPSLSLLLAAAHAAFALAASAATRVWDGGSAASGNWSDAANWNPNTAPVAGDQLVFPAGAARTVHTNNISGGSFDRISFTGDGYQIYGNNLRVTNGVASGNASGNNVFRPNLVGTPGNPAFIVTNGGGALTLSGTLDISGQRVTVDGAGSLLLGGNISGSAAGTSINKFGSGLLTFYGTNTYTGDHTNHAGTIRCSGRLGGGTWRLQPGAVLDGNGWVYWLNSSTGTIRPGTVGAGRLTFDQAFVLSSGSTVEIEINGPAPGTEHDQIVVTNLATLGSAILNVALNYAPLAGEQFVILEKQGPGVINGTFIGLGEGASFVLNGARLAITYKGGSSNEIVLTVANIEPTGVAREWDGGGGANTRWTVPANWVGDVAPNPGDDLIFPTLFTRGTLTNNYTGGTTFNSIRFTGSEVTLVGNGIVLNAGVTNEAAASNAVLMPLVLQSNQTFHAGPAGGVLACFGGLTSAGRSLTLSGDGDCFFGGSFSGNALTKFGTGTTWLNAVNTHTGLTTVASGTLVVPRAGALGTATSTSGTTVSNTALLRVEGGFVLPENVRLNGTLASAGTNVFTGLFINTGFTGTVEVAAGSRAVFSNQFSLASLVKNGDGEMELAGSAVAGQRITGVTRVNAGTLFLNKPFGFYAVSDLIIGEEIPLVSNAVVRLLNSDQLQTGGSVTVNRSGWLDLNDETEQIGGLRLFGGRVTTGSGQLSCSALITGTSAVPAVVSGRLAPVGNPSFTFTVSNGPPDVDLIIEASVENFTAPAGLILKSGGGTLSLSGANSYNATTIISAGRVLVENVTINSLFSLQGGTLGGDGAVRSLTASSVVGSQLTPGSSPGILQSGNVSLRPQVTFLAELDGPRAGREYDQLDVTGFVDLNGAALDLRLGFTPALGDEFAIVQNDGAEAVTNTFASLPQLSYFTNGGALFRIDYAGGDGNDVVLTRSAVPPSTITGIRCLTNGWKQINGQGLPGFPYVLQGTTNLTPTIIWLPVGTNNADGAGLYMLVDTDAPNHPWRFYRVGSP